MPDRPTTQAPAAPAAVSAADAAELPAELLDALLRDAAPAEHDPLFAPRAARIRQRALARIAPPAATSPPDAVAAAQGGAPGGAGVRRAVLSESWPMLFDGCEATVLSDDGVDRTWLIRLAPGRCLPAHGHALASEQCLVLEGEVLVGNDRFHAGDFHLALRGSYHADVRTESGCVLLLRSPSPRTPAV